MKIISWNVNGLRAVKRKGELDNLLDNYNPDILLLQETKSKPEQLSEKLVNHPDYLQFYNSAERPGYAGTSIWIKKTCEEIFSNENSPMEFSDGMPDFTDNEGRISRIDFQRGNDAFSILGIYFPNGGKSQKAWEEKLVFYEKFLNYTNTLRSEGKIVIWGGDVNCAHEEIDLARPKNNMKSIGFLPEERTWISKCIKQGWIDIWRKTNPKTADVYSWWHVITRSRLRNVGWRIDYFFCDEKFFPKVKKIEYLNNQMGSDHCPVMLEV
ncbi:exodeoxyribonuclease III [Candidatus Gracilibacteria bacterium]|nr:exodeoxyribonuclease III [Candidatus Gracilibacteria bacterium]